MGITRDELAKETYRVFGGTRVTPTARERLDRAMEVIVREGRVQVVAGVVIPTGKRLSWRISYPGRYEIVHDPGALRAGGDPSPRRSARAATTAGACGAPTTRGSRRS